MMTVLLIEPDRVLAHTYVRALQHGGYGVVHVQSVQDAIDAADDQKPGIVIIELQMAVHDGVEFLHEFRSYPEWREVPVIIHTVLPPSALAPVRTALEFDFRVTTCLYKPRTTLQQLVSTVNLHFLDAA